MTFSLCQWNLRVFLFRNFLGVIILIFTYQSLLGSHHYNHNTSGLLSIWSLRKVNIKLQRLVSLGDCRTPALLKLLSAILNTHDGFSWVLKNRFSHTPAFPFPTLGTLAQSHPIPSIETEKHMSQAHIVNMAHPRSARAMGKGLLLTLSSENWGRTVLPKSLLKIPPRLLFQSSCRPISQTRA
jgi:hypothetical protein